jgi:GNAT superfamily N-acetyltransferase
MLKACQAVGERYWTSDQGPFVREAKQGDIALLMRILSILGRAPPLMGNAVETAIAEQLLELHRRAARAEQVFLVAEIWGEVVGGIVVTAEQGQVVARIELLVVGGPFNQGKGAGSLLLNEAMKRMGQKGYRTFTASYPKSPFGPTFFKKFGWRLLGAHDGKLLGAGTIIEEWRSA